MGAIVHPDGRTSPPKMQKVLWNVHTLQKIR